MARKPAGITCLNSVNRVNYSKLDMKSVSFKAPCSTQQDRENFIIKVQDILDKCAGGLTFNGTDYTASDNYLLTTYPKPGSSVSHGTNPQYFITALTYMNKKGVLTDDALENALSQIQESTLAYESRATDQQVSR